MTEKTPNQPTGQVTKTAPALKAQVKPALAKKHNTVSKIGLLALLLSLASIAGLGGLYYWQGIEQESKAQLILAQTKQQLAVQQQQIQQLLTQQQQNANNQIASLKSQLQSQQANKITQLETELSRLAQKQPSDWLIQETEYLLRIAVRTLWFQQDPKSAISLLQEADARLKKLSDLGFLPVRQAIHQDIQALQLMPVIETQDLLLTLMAMDKQVPRLPLAFVYLPASVEPEPDLELTHSVADWQSNLNKTWQLFIDDFITVRDRTTPVEPLLSPQYQQHLIQNLRLKLQLAQWAVSQQQSLLFSQVLSDIETWLTGHFDMQSQFNQSFLEQIQGLKTQQISFDYPSSLSSLPALTARQQIKSQVIPAIKQDVKSLAPNAENNLDEAK